MDYFYTVYKTTNILTEQYYIGAHQTTNLNDRYLGSGVQLMKDIKRLGRANFLKEILYIFYTAAEMHRMESELVDLEFVNRNDTYNIALGGKASFAKLPENRRLQCSHLGRAIANSRGAHIKGSSKHFLLLETDEVYASNYKMKCKQGCAKIPNEVKQRIIYKSRSPEAITKKKATLKSIQHQQGSNNSQFGTKWIYHPVLHINKRIVKDEDILCGYLAPGWLCGRKMKFEAGPGTDPGISRL